MINHTIQQIKTNRNKGIYLSHQRLKNMLYHKRKNRLFVRPNNKGFN